MTTGNPVTFEILAGLPSSGPMPVQFTYGDKRTHSEGLVVAFGNDGARSWVGNFQCAIGVASGVFAHPDGHHVVVIAGGEGYIVDPATRELTATFGGGINEVWPMTVMGALVFDDSGVAFSALGARGWQWRTKRISWDGFDALVLTGKQLGGQAWDAIAQRWLPFRLILQQARLKAARTSRSTPRSSNVRCNCRAI